MMSRAPTNPHSSQTMNGKNTFVASRHWDLGGCWLSRTNLSYPHWYIWNDQWLLPAHKTYLIPLLVFKVFCNFTWIYLSNIFSNNHSDITICSFQELNSSENSTLKCHFWWSYCWVPWLWSHNCLHFLHLHSSTEYIIEHHRWIQNISTSSPDHLLCFIHRNTSGAAKQRVSNINYTQLGSSLSS